MKLRALVLVCSLAFGLVASTALAGPGRGHGKEHDDTTAAASEATGSDVTTTAAPDCRLRVTYVLRGTLSAIGVDTISVDVATANRHGRRLVGDTVELAVRAATKVRRNGPATFGELVVGDDVKVQARCTAAGLAARAVSATPAVGADDPNEFVDDPVAVDDRP